MALGPLQRLVRPARLPRADRAGTVRQLRAHLRDRRPVRGAAGEGQQRRPPLRRARDVGAGEGADRRPLGDG